MTKESKPRKSLSQMAIEAGSGIVCPQCECRDFRVTNVWTSGGSRKRLRRCRNCGTPITTLELPIPEGYEVRVVPTDSQVDP